MTVRQAYLQGFEAQGASLAGAHVSESVLTAGSRLSAYIGATVGEIGFLRGIGQEFAIEVTPRRIVEFMRFAQHARQLGPEEAFHHISVALSPEGSHMLTGTTTGEVCLWRVADRRRLQTVTGHTGPIMSVSLSNSLY